MGVNLTKIASMGNRQLKMLREKNINKNAEESTTTWIRSFELFYFNRMQFLFGKKNSFLRSLFLKLNCHIFTSFIQTDLYLTFFTAQYPIKFVFNFFTAEQWKKSNTNQIQL